MKRNMANLVALVYRLNAVLSLRYHFRHPSHSPIQTVLSSVVLPKEQSSHYSSELRNWLTASDSLSLSLSGLCASADRLKQLTIVWQSSWFLVSSIMLIPVTVLLNVLTLLNEKYQPTSSVS